MTQFRLNNRWTIWLLILIFVIPLIAAYFLSKNHEQMGLGTKNHGQLITPPLDFNQLKPVTTTTWRGQWMLLLVIPTHCDSFCEKQIYLMQQIRTATGKDSNRVTRGVLTFSTENKPLATLVQTRFPGTHYFTTSTERFQNLVKGSSLEKVAFMPGNIYLVDPQGNILMRYPAQTNPMGIFKDLTLLLKISNIG
ncbi:MAG: hypothetical protein QM752_04650 [Gammaproteobacteria bacterium]